MSLSTEVEAIDHELLLKEISALTTQFDIFRMMKTVTHLFRMRAFIVFRIPAATTRSLQSVSIITNWPSELLTRFDAENLLEESIFARHIRKSSLPVAVDLRDVKFQGQAHPRIAELFIQHDMASNVFFPVADPVGDRGVIGFSGNRDALSSLELLQINMISAYVFERLYLLGKNDQKVGDDLTRREIDCLNWTAAGKTSIEIADILNLSEHTVNHYLNRAARKLDTVNRTQAVAKALRMGIIN